jgi:hypothetical protein
MRLSDFPRMCVPGVRRLAFPGRSNLPSLSDTRGISRVPCEEFPRIHRVYDCAGSAECSPSIAPFSVAFRASNGVGTLNTLDFAAQWLVYVYPCQRFTCSIAITRA